MRRSGKETGQRDTANAAANGDGILTDTTTSAVERMADDLEENAKIFPNEDDHSSICATLRALAAERDALHAQLASEKALADRLYIGTDNWADRKAYRKARGM